MGTVLLPQDAEGIPHLSLVSVPFSMGTVLLLVCRICIVCGLRPFQSPSRWGRCCFAAWVTRLPALRSFSPLLDGDGVASLDWPARAQAKSFVSVPFSMGTVLLRPGRSTANALSSRFSPLLDGDGVASLPIADAADHHAPVSVPFSMGTVLLRNGYLAEDDAPAVSVSVPFSMGTVLLPWTKEQPTSFNTSFQSPSRWGRCCFPRGRRPAQRHLVVSVPFSMGTVLLRLLDGPTVQCFFGFSPLLDGDGVASDFRYLDTVAISAFQSPSRWGRCCFRFRTSTFYTTSSRASLPFSRRWRFCAETRSICEPRRHHTSPQ